MKKNDSKYVDRDLSWLSFNARILQEASNKKVPLMERLKFVAIYSSNLEEFYRVRVASHRFKQKYKGDKKNKFGYKPSYILQQINTIVNAQQKKLGGIFFDDIVPEMEAQGIHLLFDDLNPKDLELVSDYFDTHLSNSIEIISLNETKNLELLNQAVYLYIIQDNDKFLIKLDYSKHGRFITLDQNDKRIIQLDDIYKHNLEKIFGKGANAFAVKVSRDAELYIDEEQDENIIKKIKKSLKKRETGLPSRLLFDGNIPFKYINDLRDKLQLDITSLISGGKYHNFYDFFQFPAFKNKEDLYYGKPDTLVCKRLEACDNYFDEIKKEDVFLSFPYQDFKYVYEFLEMAANDDAVEEINTTLYRVNKESKICEALETAARNGKKVFVFAEVLARFDEESNIYWGERLEKAGAVVKYDQDGLKVHAKIYTIKRREQGELVSYSYLGTGNLNEKTAKIYADHGVLSARQEYTKDLEQVFGFLQGTNKAPTFENLLVAPFVLRNTAEDLIKQEIKFANEGRKAEMYIKLNSLEDPEMIALIRDAADAGVKIKLIVRGICCYYPLNKNQANNINTVSVIDKFLEHTRIYHFHNNGNPKTYLASADWMTRNLSERIEVAFPLFNQDYQKILMHEMEFQLSDSYNGRVIDSKVENEYIKGDFSWISKTIL